MYCDRMVKTIRGRQLTVAAVALFFAACSCKKPQDLPKAQMPVAFVSFPKGSTIVADVAATPKDREYGLMNRTSLPENYGMLFVFPRQQVLQFWMKDTLVDLDMIFLDQDKRITEVFKNVPRSSPSTPEQDLARRNGLGQYVLELPAGAAQRLTLSPGQTLTFAVQIPLE